MRNPRPLSPFSVETLRDFDAEFFARPYGQQAITCHWLATHGLMDVMTGDGGPMYRTNEAGRAKVAKERQVSPC